MLFAREYGALLRGEADYQLHWVYLWYEEQPQRGLAVLQRLHARYPRNPLFQQRIAEVEQQYFHDPSASLAIMAGIAGSGRRRTCARGTARGGADTPRVGRAAR